MIIIHFLFVTLIALSIIGMFSSIATARSTGKFSIWVPVSVISFLILVTLYIIYSANEKEDLNPMNKKDSGDSTKFKDDKSCSYYNKDKWSCKDKFGCVWDNKASKCYKNQELR